MKALVTIFMLVLLLYNSVGFYIVFQIQHQKAEEEFEAFLQSTEFTDADLTVFKIPVSQYYELGGKDFNRVEGDFAHNGKFYEIVKQRIENDTIYNYCLNNERIESLYAQLYEHVNTHLVNGKPSKNKGENLGKILLKEYLPKNPNNIVFALIFPKKEKSTIFYLDDYSSQSLTLTTPPPELS